MIEKKIKKKISEKINIIKLDLTDESYKHAGHAQSTGSHFKIYIVSDDFIGISLIERHRMIYSALKDMLKQEIHALSINAKTSKE